MKPTLKELYQHAKNSGNDKVCRFMRDMKRAGLVKDMYYYSGRWFWHGPAVNCSEIQDVLSETKIPCQWDNMGLGYVVYPKQGVTDMSKLNKE